MFYYRWSTTDQAVRRVCVPLPSAPPAPLGISYPTILPIEYRPPALADFSQPQLIQTPIGPQLVTGIPSPDSITQVPPVYNPPSFAQTLEQKGFRTGQSEMKLAPSFVDAHEPILIETPFGLQFTWRARSQIMQSQAPHSSFWHPPSYSDVTGMYAPPEFLASSSAATLPSEPDLQRAYWAQPISLAPLYVKAEEFRIQWVDLRSADELAKGHLVKSVNLPLETLISPAAFDSLPKGMSLYMLILPAVEASTQALEAFTKAGFPNSKVAGDFATVATLDQMTQ